MRKISEAFHYLEFDTHQELPERDQYLVNHAKEAMKAAYTPYSHFPVGAAVLLVDGTIVIGNNQENRAFPSGLCAERVAIFAAGANHPGVPVEAIAIAAHSDGFAMVDPVPPCGACRQTILEYELKQNQNIRIILSGKSGKVFVIESVKQLLPLAFVEDRLGKPKEL